MKKALLMVLSLVLVVALTIGGTLAYLTDRDSKTNVFTVGDVRVELNEDFEQGATLIPGVDIEKKATVKNIGKNDAWVWVKIAIPSALDNDDASKNVIHFNMSKDSVAPGLWNWQDDAGAWMIAEDVAIDNVLYNVYTVKYDTVLKPGETTAQPVMYKVYMDYHIDIDTNGDWYHVENGVVTDLEWNTETDGAPVMYVSAYAIQAEGFGSANDAIAAYNAQWGDKGDELAPAAKVYYSAADVKAAIDAGEKDIVVKNATFAESMPVKSDVNITFVDCTFTGASSWKYANNATFERCVFDCGSDNAAIHFDQLYGELVVKNCTFTSGKVQIGTDGSAEAFFENCTFAETATTSIWAEKGMRFYCPTTFTDCEFNNRVVLAGSNDLPLTFDSCTMNGGSSVYYVDNTDGIIRGGNIPAVTIK